MKYYKQSRNYPYRGIRRFASWDDSLENIRDYAGEVGRAARNEIESMEDRMVSFHEAIDIQIEKLQKIRDKLIELGLDNKEVYDIYDNVFSNINTLRIIARNWDRTDDRQIEMYKDYLTKFYKYQ